MSMTDSTDSKPKNTGEAGGLQKVDRKAALAALRQPAGEIVDLHELEPVMASFSQHLAQEQERNRRRLRALGLAFALALAVVLVVPIYFARMFVRSNNAQWRAQQQNQEKIAKSIADGMVAMGAQSQQLREELVRERALRATAATSAPQVVVQTIIVTAVVPASVVSPSPLPQQTVRPMNAGPVAIPQLFQGIGVTIPPAFDAQAAYKFDDMQDTDLKSMLDQVEKAIESTRHELDARGGAAIPKN